MMNEFTFRLNLAGYRGTALFSKGLSEVYMTESTFETHKAVDAFQEKSLIPAYNKYLLGLDVDGNTDKLVSLRGQD